jgi:hypothetical protein
MRCTGGEVRLIDLIRTLGSERDAKVLHFVVVSAFVSDRKPSRAERKKEHMLNMKFRPTLLLVIVLLASAGLTLAQNPDPTGTGNQTAVDMEKGIPPIPVITGGIALNSSFTSNEAALLPVVAPIILVPLGKHALIETEFEAESEVVHTEGSWQPVTLEKGVEYAQLDLFLNKYMTLVAGRYATPFNFYKERLDARWIRNLPEAPLIFGAGDNSSNGGMLRGAVPLGSSVQWTYSGFFSALTSNLYAGSERQTGGRTGLFFPKPRFEAAFSFNRRLAPVPYDTYGADFTWNVRSVPLDVRGEALVSAAAGDGYWVEAAYRLSSPRFSKWLRRSQAVVRGEQYFMPRTPIDTGLEMPESDAGRIFAGWNYWITDNVRAGVAYGRQVGSIDDHNICTLGISYRFVR